MRRSRVFQFILVGFIALGAASAAQAQVVFGNFEDGNLDGFGYLSSSSGVLAFPASPGPVATVETPPAPPAGVTLDASADTTKVLDINGAGYNGGQSGGNDIGYDFAANGLASQFLANDILSFNWEVPPSTAASGYSQIYNLVLNAPGAGYKTVGGSSGATSTLATVTGTVNQYPGYSGQLNTVSINYDAYKALITASPSYIQFGITTNNGTAAPADIYFDNFTLSHQAPEPASLCLGAVGVLLMLRRRRHV